jgi:hypothetical protein
VEIISSCKVLDVGVRYCKPCILSTLLERVFPEDVKVSKHSSTVPFIVNTRTTVARHRGAVSAQYFEAKSTSYSPARAFHLELDFTR